MRQPIDTAPRDGNVVILEDDAAGTYDVAHWSPEVGDWITESGQPSKITPSHWHPIPIDRYQEQAGEAPSKRLFSLRRASPQGQTAGDSASPAPTAPAVPAALEAAGPRTPRVEAERLPSSRRRLAAASLAAAFIISVLIVTYFYNEDGALVTRNVGQPTGL